MQLFGQRTEDLQTGVEQNVPRSPLLSHMHHIFTELHAVRLGVAGGPVCPPSVGNPPKLWLMLHAISNILRLLLFSTQ